LKNLIFEMGALYYLKLDYSNEVVVQRCCKPRNLNTTKLWFKLLAAQEKVGIEMKGGYRASLYKDQIKRIVKKKRLKVTDLPLYVGLNYVSPEFIKLIEKL
jgi:hypothetical protein